MRILILIMTAAITVGFADTLSLRNGKTVNGNYLGGNARQIRMDVGDRVESYDVSEVAGIKFESSAPVAARPTRPADTEPRVLRPAPVAAAPAPTRAAVTIPEGTPITIRMIDA